MIHWLSAVDSTHARNGSIFTPGTLAGQRRCWGILTGTSANLQERPPGDVFELQQAGRLRCDVEYYQYFVGTKAQLFASDRMEGLRRLSQFLLTQPVCR
jgi:hypothetical protein